MSVDDLLTAGVIIPVSEITAYLDGQPLGVVPITQGAVSETATGPTLGRLSITLPATTDWIPRHPGHPLAAYGQELIVRRGFRTPSGGVIGWENLGRFRITATPRPSQGWLEVEAESVDCRLTLGRFVVDTRTVGSYRQQVKLITSGVVPVTPVAVDAPAGPRSWEQQGSRRDALLELVDAWGASLRMVTGQLMIVPAETSTTPTITVRAGTGGTLLSLSPVAEGDVVPNAVVASTAPEDATAPIMSMVTVAQGPRRWGGPYGPVPEFFSSPLLSSYGQCQTAARTRLARLQAQAPDVAVEMVTDPRIRLDSVVRLIDDEGTDCVVRVTEVTHALTPGQEPGSLRGTLVSGVLKGESWR